MDSVIEFYKAWQPDVTTLFVCLPEIILAALALLALVFDVFVKSDAAKCVARGFIGAVLAALFILVAGGAIPSSNIGETPLFFLAGAFGRITTPLFIAIAFFTLYLSRTVCSREINAGVSVPATTHLVLIATAAASLLLKASNFVAFFVLLETLTVCLYALVGSSRGSAYSLEGGVKYLIAGGVSGALTLFGIVLIYGAHAIAGLPGLAVPGLAGDVLGYFETAGFFLSGSAGAVGIAGAGMVLAGVMFKLGVFPMQFWIPDVYQGAPTHITFFLATLSKATGFFLLLTMLAVFSGIWEIVLPVLTVCALISIVYANLTALGQRNVKRLLGLSGVSHAGYLTLGLLAAFTVRDNVCFALVFLYLLVYIVSVCPIFSVMTHMPQADDALQNFDDYAGLSKKNPLLAGSLAFGLGSLAGIPPTVGFIAKLGLLYVLFSAEFYISTAIMLACVVAGIFYYFGWFRAAFSSGEEIGTTAGEGVPANAFTKIILVVLSVAMVAGVAVYWVVLS